jgi:hypothetical protein
LLGWVCPQFSRHRRDTSQLIGYDVPLGAVVLAQAGSETMASGFVQGENIQQASGTFIMGRAFFGVRGHLIATMAFGRMPG